MFLAWDPSSNAHVEANLSTIDVEEDKGKNFGQKACSLVNALEWQGKGVTTSQAALIALPVSWAFSEACSHNQVFNIIGHDCPIYSRTAGANAHQPSRILFYTRICSHTPPLFNHSRVISCRIFWFHDEILRLDRVAPSEVLTLGRKGLVQFLEPRRQRPIV